VVGVSERQAADSEPVGDPVCWLHELCPACGAAPSVEDPDRCWRCGTTLDAAREDQQ
jgi:hypothetical protein